MQRYKIIDIKGNVYAQSIMFYSQALLVVDFLSEYIQAKDLKIVME